MGVIIVLTMMIGLLTPPFGMVLFVLSRISGSRSTASWSRSAPSSCPLLAVTVLLLLVPPLVTFLPRVVM
jgi:TRAP-type C4-dicarboxylate transport system permease large subunit